MFSIGRKKSPYLVEIGEEDDFLDVPEKFASTEYYVASTGHKINHKRESNGRFEECLHPRFGWIHCFISNRVMLVDAWEGGELEPPHSTLFKIPITRDFAPNYFRILSPGKSFSASTTLHSIATA